MSVDTLVRAIAEAAIAAEGMDPSMSLRWSDRGWVAIASGLAQDVHTEAGSVLDRTWCYHVADDEHEWATVWCKGTVDESAEAVLTALLEYVTTETPVPA